MSVPFSGCWSRSAGEVAAIGKQLKLLNLKAAKRVTIKFDPFRKDVGYARTFAHLITSPKIFATNPSCSIKTEIICDRTEPLVIFNLTPEVAEEHNTKQIVLKGGNLTTLELLKLCNKFVTAIAPKEEEVVELQTKASKKKSR